MQAVSAFLNHKPRVLVYIERDTACVLQYRVRVSGETRTAGFTETKGQAVELAREVAGPDCVIFERNH